MSQPRETPAADAPTPSELQDAAMVLRELPITMFTNERLDEASRSILPAVALLDRAASALTEQAKAIARLREALLEIEFETSGFCKACNGWNMSEAGSTRGVHTKNCPVARALAESEGGAG